VSFALTFLGAAGTVTGAKFLVEGERARLLLECGMFQGLREFRARNWEPPPVEPATLGAVLLSHAHLDHSGYLPPSGTYAVHGEPPAAEALRDAIEKELGWPCRVAADGERIGALRPDILVA